MDLYSKALESRVNGLLYTAIDYYKDAIDKLEDFAEAHQNVALIYDQIETEGICIPKLGCNLDLLESSRYHTQQSILHAPSRIFKADAIVNLVLLEYHHLPFVSKETVAPIFDLLGKL